MQSNNEPTLRFVAYLFHIFQYISLLSFLPRRLRKEFLPFTLQQLRTSH